MVKQTQDKILSQLLKKHKDFVQTQSGKIRCEITNHEMSNVKEFKEYLKGKAYKRGLESNFDVADYSEYLDAHFTNPKLLFCRLTGQKVVNKRSVVEKHVKGKRYTKALKKLQDEEQKKLERQSLKKERINKRKQERQSKQQEEEDVEQMVEQEPVDQVEDNDIEQSQQQQPQPKQKKRPTANIQKHKKISKKQVQKQPSQKIQKGKKPIKSK